jgi:hypothetical protein
MKFAAIPTGALRVLSPVVLILFFLFVTASASQAQTERRYPGRGAVSAQDFAKLTSPAANGTSAADQVCSRYAAGSIVSDPPVLQSQNGVLEVTMGFYTVPDSQGLVHYCYVTNTGLEAPTLIVNPGDNLIIHFQNDMLAPSTTSERHGEHEDDALQQRWPDKHQLGLQREDGHKRHQHPLPRDQHSAGMRAG